MKSSEIAKPESANIFQLFAEEVSDAKPLVA
jgi:hypothetical protein